MSFTAIEKMRQDNLQRFGKDLGPMQPVLTKATPSGNDLKSAALRFVHERCEDLRFSAEKSAEEERTGNYLGSSIKPGQIPYNMQMDIDRLCLERELEKFIDSGVAEDAYTVYYCFLEMFFGHYGKSKKMVELLSEFESNGSSLLMKHRDHYSHSVYVFALGLAIYETNSAFRKIFSDFYGLGAEECDAAKDHAAACKFLEFWGLTSLFHDIGYPFELPFEQVISYYEVGGRARGDKDLYFSYKNVDSIREIDAQTQKQIKALYGRDIKNSDELLAFDIFSKLGETYGFTEESILECISNRATHPEKCDLFMDHAYFSSARLFREITRYLDGSALSRMHVDAVSAIMLHNSLYKFSVSFYKSSNAKAPLKAELHPLAYMLMLCDELQCWDRTAYGRNSRTELHPMGADFDFGGGRIKVTYSYDIEEKAKIDRYMDEYRSWALTKEGKEPRLKAYSDMYGKKQKFKKDIEKIVDTAVAPLTVLLDLKPADRSVKHTYLSGSNFLHLYDFAVALNSRYSYQGREREVDTAQLESEFEGLSLEYQLSNINQAKSFAKYLNAIHCFYTDRPVDYEMIKAFTPQQTAVFAPMEHARWVREHISMGWSAGDEYDKLGKDKEERKALREQLRMHVLSLNGAPTDEELYQHYRSLPESEQDKDWLPFNSMLELIKKFDGLRIYQLQE